MSRMIRMLVLTAACSILGTRAAAQDNYRYENIVEQIETLKIKSLEELLPNVPPELRRDFVLMTQSKSSHLATTIAPRVILCSPTAKLMMAYSTDKKDENRHVLEVIQWRDKTDRFEFREIAFDPAGVAEPKFSEANPSRCAACHGEASRPNWEPAGKWPGALGQETRWGDAEIKRMEILAKRKDTRLRLLEWPGFGAETPSARMAKRANVLNMRRFARFVRESQNYDEYKFAIVAGLLGLKEFLSVEPIRGLYLERPADYDDRFKETKSVLSTLIPTYYAPPDVSAIASVRMVFEPRNISLRDMSTSFRNPVLLTGNARTDFGAVVVALYEMDPELRDTAPLPPEDKLFTRDGVERARLGDQLVKAAAQKDFERRQKVVQALLQR